MATLTDDPPVTPMPDRAPSRTMADILHGGADSFLRLQPGRVRLADVFFHPWDRLPSKNAHLQTFAEFAPDLAIEIVSVSNTPAELRRRRNDFFAAGTRLVWDFDPRANTVAVYTNPATHTLLTDADSLTGELVLPGFKLILKDLFDEPQLNPEP